MKSINHKFFSFFLAGLIGSTLLLLGSSSAFAQTTNTWTGQTGSDWNTVANWSLTAVPGTGDDVVIPAGITNSPLLSTNAVAKSVEVQPGASLTISSSGSLSINGSKLYSGGFTRGFSNSGQVRNEGRLVLGNTGSVGDFGLYNESTFTNTVGGRIQIDRTGALALYNYTGGSFVNSATIVIGSDANPGGGGLYNAASFTNTTGGSIQIDRTGNTGLHNSGGSFVNSATIVIGGVANVGSYGLYNASSFTNEAGGSVQIDRTSSEALYNHNGTFVNQATITIGASVTGVAIINFVVFSNQGCQALINSLGNAVISGFSSFSNTGTIIERSSGNSNISYNGGLVQNLNGGTFSIGSGNAAVTGAGHFWRGCVSSDWNTAANWSAGTLPTATDDVTIPAGTTYSPLLRSTAVAKSVEVQPGASLTISNSGSLSINGSKLYSYGSTSGFSNSGQVRNEGQLVLGNIGSVGNCGLYNASSFTNAVGGSIQIDRTGIYGLFNAANSSFVNSATIVIGAVADVGSFGLFNASSFTNTAGGRIQIERTIAYGLYNNTGGSFVNSATIAIGSAAIAVAYGLYNAASFTNTAAGIIQIDGTSSYGLSNISGGSFVNSATIVIGAIANIGNYGLYNTSSFTNAAGGSVQIDRVSLYGLSNISGGSFVNSAIIVIGAAADAGSYGLVNASSFTNTAGGRIQIDRTRAEALYNNNGSFVNQATITIGTSASANAIFNSAIFNNEGCQALINSLGNAVISNANSFSNTGTIIERSSGNSNISYNGGLVQNLNGGTFSIGSGNAAVTGAGLFWRGCVSSDWNTAANWSAGAIPTAADDVTIPAGTTNSPLLSTTAVANSVEVQSGASLTISSSGSLTINGSKTYGGIGGFSSGFSNSGQVRNEGRLVLGNTGSVGAYGLYNASSFTNAAGGRIQIDRAFLLALHNYTGGSFINSATILIGSVADVGAFGLYNESSFSNTAGGSIQIDRVSDYGLYNVANSSLVNSATILIGSVATVGNYGLYNAASFTNTATGRIQIDRARDYGLYNLFNSNFVNSATIIIGAVAMGYYGLFNAASFSNLTGGNMSIDRTSGYALYNNNGSFVNQATITIGTSASANAIFNSAIFNNEGCQALINSLGNAVISNANSFSNTGTIIERSSGNSNISYNGGLVQNLNGGSFTVASGSLPLSLSATNLTTCNPVNGSFTLTGVQPNTAYTLSYTLGNATASLSQTGNAAGQLTAANLSAGTYALALSGSCVAQTLPLSATLNPPAAFTITTQPPATSVICAGSSISAAVGVSGATGPVTYQWYKNSLASPVASQTAASLLLSGLTAAESGSYSVVITDNCTSATSAAFRLTVNPLPSVTVTAAPSATLTCTNPALTLTAQTTATVLAWSSNNATSQTLPVSQSGVYSVTVTDGNGCTAVSNSLTITQDVTTPTVSLPPAGSVLTCTQPQITLTATASTTTLRWSTGQTTLTLPVSQSGVYSVTATGTNGCTAVSNSLTITQDNTSPTVSISATGNQLTCTQPTLMLTATASVTALRWSTGQTTATISVTAAGTYSVTATGANGCSAVSNNLLVSENFSLPPFMVSSATVCPGQPVSLTALGCGGQVRWSNGMSGSMITLTAGNSTSLLTATCTVGICSATAAGQVVVGGIQPPPAQILSFTADESACPVRLTGRGVASTFTMTGPGSYVFSTVYRAGTTHEAVGLNVKQAGTYTLTATYSNSCGTSAPVTRTVSVGRNCP